MKIGYCRTSTTEQVAGFEAQGQMLLATGCTRIFREQVSSVAVRAELDAALDFVREGDTLVVSRLDRLARSTTDLLGIVATLERKGVALRILDFGGSEVDTKSPTGRMLLTMFAAVAEFERGVMLERQRAGIAKAKAEGRYRGRAPTARAKAHHVRSLSQAGIGASGIAAELSISRASVYRILAAGGRIVRSARTLFAAIAAELEDMHAVAIDAQAPGITADEGTALLAVLREGVDRLKRLIVKAA